MQNSKAFIWREQERRSWQSDWSFPRLAEAVSGYVYKRIVFSSFSTVNPGIKHQPIPDEEGVRAKRKKPLISGKCRVSANDMNSIAYIVGNE
jgi:hypothetical protein